MRSTVALAVLLTACTSEAWVLAPEAALTVELAEGETVIEGDAILVFDEEALPMSDEVVSNALRLTVHTPVPQGAVMDFPRAYEHDLIDVGDDRSLNLDGVYRDCGQATCEVVVPFRITREATDRRTVELTGDALLSRHAVWHQTAPELEGAATLALEVDRIR